MSTIGQRAREAANEHYLNYGGAHPSHHVAGYLAGAAAESPRRVIEELKRLVPLVCNMCESISAEKIENNLVFRDGCYVHPPSVCPATSIHARIAELAAEINN
jgi:hypothetical protein